MLSACGDDNPTTPPGIPTQGLMAFLAFDGNASDGSGGGNDGTLVGGATAAGALVLGNNNTDMLMLPATVMDGLGDFTFAAWLRIDTFREESHEVISGANVLEDNALIFWYREPTDEWVIGVNDGASTFPADSRIEDGTWHHVAVLRSGSTTRLYLDGSAFGAEIAIDPDLLQIDPGGMIFGQDQDTLGGDFEANSAWAGAMDNLRIYNRALSADEIKRVAEEAHS
jgi:hypothetical protein